MAPLLPGRLHLPAAQQPLLLLLVRTLLWLPLGGNLARAVLVLALALLTLAL